MRILIIVNYDSFVCNLAQYLGELGGEPIVYRNNAITLEKARELRPERIVISPGPGNPVEERYFGVSARIIMELGKNIPTLGVCLGHQGIGHVFGAKIRRAKTLKHGKTSMIDHDGKGIYSGIDVPFVATRYHSLAVDEERIPRDLEVTAKSQDDDEIMGLRHKDYPIEGLQYHPESILTDLGMKILRNFLDEGVKR